MNLAPLTQRSILYVADRMRDDDRREIFATRWADSPSQLAVDCLAAPGFKWVAHDDQPIAALGAIPRWPGVWSVWMFATDEFPRIGATLTRFVRRRMIPMLLEAGAHRAECLSIEGHDTAHRWLEFLGAKRSEPIMGLGKSGETFYCYSWARDDVLRTKG